jgi:soluble lytic murein transglycosylase
MRFNRFMRISLLALAAVTATASPSLVSETGQAIAAPKVSGLAVQAAKLALKGDFVEAGQLAQRSGDAAAIKLVELIYLRDHPNDAGYQRIMSFLEAAPNWPLTESLMKRAERSLYVNNESSSLIMGHFAKRQPVTAEGSLALARALLANGDKDTARKYVQKVWFNPDIDAKLESSVMGEFGKLLTVDDHKKRMWRLVYAQETNAAIRAAKRLPGEYQKAAGVAQKLLRGEKGAEKSYSALPASMREATGMKYALTRFYRKNESYTKARAILASIPGDASKMGDPEAWWTERRIIARHSIGVKSRSHAKTAYQISKNHGFSKGEEALEGEFLAGWIALRYMKEPGVALKHFSKLGEIAESRTEKARAGYWTGRALEALGQKADAKAAYKQSSQYTTIYYGQLAREKIGLGKVPEEIVTGKASAAARAKADKDEVVRAFKMVADAGGKSELYMFLWAFANRFNTVDEMNAVADLVWDEGGVTMAVRLAKASGSRNIDIDSWGYPIRALPDWKQIGKPVERSLVFALARQESEFNPTAGSKVGAQGLMQIMPATAKIIAKQHGVKHQTSMLTGDPAHNVKLGAAHLGDLIDNFGGSYVLTLVAYNAGPRRSKEWVAEYGDLRTGETDPIDWVESIPFQETRQYVQKVLQNLHIYRSRLAPKTVRPMTADLARGSTTDSISVSSTSAPEEEAAAAPAAACAKASIADLLSSCD